MMIGIEKITAKITADAEADVKKLQADTQAKIDAIQAETAAQVAQETQAILARGEKAAAERLERLESAAQMEQRKLVLAAKQEVVGEAFEQAVEKLCQLPDKELILRVLSMYNDPEEREMQIKNISSIYSELADEVLPKLRRARITMNYQLIGRSDTQIKEQYEKEPRELSLEEILYSAILHDDIEKKKEIYNTAARLYPADYRAYNNLGVIAYNSGDLTTAAQQFAKAAKADSSAPEVKVNLGYMQLLEGNVHDAESYITMGTDSKVGDEALGNLYIAQGEYGKATSFLQGVNSNSAALAQLLNKDYSKARATLDAIENPDATTHYIKAVLGARTSNISFVYDGLKNAIKLDPSLARKAASDLEFIKYAQDATFLNIIK